jgi:hypothetical protein
LIDDEADNASIDGKAVSRDENGTPLEDEDPTKINKQIRTILNKFQKSSYVGYTATPFANIFIYPKSYTQKDWGEDLFPRSFVVNLPTPSNYIGPVKVFGLNEDNNISEPLPIVRIINDYVNFIPDKHKATHLVQGDIPSSLDNAIKSFIISCAIRILRGQANSHNSMLVHITRFVNVQAQIVSIIDNHIRYLRSCLKYDSSPAGNNIWDSFKILLEDYQATSDKINEMCSEDYVIPEWTEIAKTLYDAASKIEVKEINGSARDVLEYNNREERGMYVIAVGGDKLSRGLTLEGLTVSYYLRASKMYDTLMQMGRWFGYRPDYLDLCRLYTSPELVEWYQYIALASQELREEFNYMYSINATPEVFGLRVRNHPGVLQITATNKLRNGTKMRVSFKNSLCETVHFYESREAIDHNLLRINNLVGNLKQPAISDTHFCWKDVRSESLISFLQSYRAHPLNTKAEPRRLAEYIESQVRCGELTNWSVYLISKSQGQVDYYNAAGLSVGLVERARCEKRSGEGRYSLSNGRLITENHESLDLTTEEYKKALAAYLDSSPANNKRNMPSGIYIRRCRPAQRGLILLYLIDSGIKDHPFVGYAISFPDSTNAAEIEYTVNTTYWNQLYDDE